MGRPKRKRSISSPQESTSLARTTRRSDRMVEPASKEYANSLEPCVEKLREDLIACANKNLDLYVGVNISATALEASDVAAVLCEACQNSLAKILDPEFCSSISEDGDTDNVDHHLSLRDVVHAAEQGCSLCSLLYSRPEGSAKYSPRDYEHRYEFVLDFARLPQGGQYTKGLMQMYYTQTEDSEDFGSYDRDHRIVMEQHAGHRTSLLGVPPRHTPPLECASDWFLKCMRSHSKCGGSEERQLPPKIIDIGCSANSRIRLMATRTGQSGLYAALSHCWGSMPLIAVTTKHNIHSRFTAILPETLPRNFKDAIEVARNLGLRYLWIDSLCITQDDKDDWQAQCVLMESIYSNAAVTVAATAASGPCEGFLHQRSKRPWPSVMVSKQSRKTANPNTVLIEFSRPTKMNMNSFSLCSPRQFTPEELRRGTHTRAWCFQERLLSRRILSFAADQIHFECLTCEWHECLRRPIEFDRRAMSDRVDLHKDGFTIGHLRFEGLVKSYSGRALTLVSDRLPAFSGIACKFQSNIEDEYLAGLWKSTLVQNLCWYRDEGNESQGSDLSDPLAPSWSWASCPSSVSFLEYSVEPLANVKSASVALNGRDPFGRVNGGNLVISGMPKDCTLAMEQPCKEPDSCVVKMESLHSFDGHVLLAGKMWIDRALSTDSAFVLLPLGAESFECTFVALVLIGVQDRPRVYKRIGLFECFGTEYPDEDYLHKTDDHEHTDAGPVDMEKVRDRILDPKEALEVFKAGPRATITIV